MSTIAKMNVMLGMDSSGFDRGVQNVQRSLGDLGQKVQVVGGALTAGLTVPLLGAASAVLKLSNDLNAGMANIASLGVAEKTVQGMKKSVQELSIETGKTTDDLAQGAYQVVSAFGDTADSMKILRINAKLAKAGLASTSQAIALTSAVTKGYNDTSAEMVQHVADLSIQTVALGQTTLPEVAGAIGAMTPLASALGVKMEDLYAVMATASGVTGTTAEVSTQLRGIFQALMAPTTQMQGLMKKLGYSSGEAMLKQEGLLGTLQTIVKAADASGGSVQDYIGSVEGMTLALDLVNAQSDQLVKNQEALSNVTGRADAAFEAQTSGVNKVGFSMEQLQRKAEVLAQRIGDALGPIVLKLLDVLTPLVDKIVDLAGAFSSLDEGIQSWILAGVALVAALGPLMFILPMVAKGFAALAGIITVMTGPIGLVIAAVALLGVAWYFNWGGIQDKVTEVWGVVQPKLAEMLQTAKDYAGVQFTGFVTQLGELDKIQIPEWLKIVGALFTGGQGEGKGIQVIPITAEITPTLIEQQGASFKWEDGYLNFDARGNMTGFKMEGFFGETTGIQWDPTKGFWFTAKGEPTLSWETFANPGADPAFQKRLGEIQAHMTITPAEMDKMYQDVQKYFLPATRAIQVGVTWLETSLTYIAGYLKGFFYNAENTPQIQAEWGDNVLVTLWQNLQKAFQEGIRVFAEWGTNVLTDLWGKITSFFAGKTIDLNTTFTPGQAGKAGPFVDINPPYPSANGNYPNGVSGRANGGLAKGLAVVGEKGPELAFFGGAGANILSNKDSKKLMQLLGIPGFAGGTGPLPPMGPTMSPFGSYPVQPRPAGLVPPIGSTVAVGKALSDAAQRMSDAADSITESATSMGTSSEALRSILQSTPGLFSTSEVTADQMRGAQMGIPQNFADNYLRRLTDEVVNGVDWEGVDIGDAAAAAGIDPNLPAQAILELFKAAWNDSSLFANPENLKFIDQGAVKEQIKRQQDQLAGQYNILQLFGIKDENIAAQIQGLGSALTTNFDQVITPELMAPVGTKMLAGIGTGLGDDATATTASGNMIGAIQTALTKAEMTAKMTDAGESAAATYWSGWLKFFSTVTIPTPAPPGGTTPPTGMARGGPVSRGVPYIVGDGRGPELFVPNAAGRIIPNEQIFSDANVNGAGFRVDNLHVYNEVDIRALAYQVAGYMQRRR